MADCIEKDVKDLLRRDCVANKKAGFRPYILLAKWNDVLTWPTFKSTDITLSENEKDVTTTGDIVLKAGKAFKKIEAVEIEKIDLNTKKNGNSFETELKLKAQNTDDSRGWCKNATGVRFIALVYENDYEKPLLLGHENGYFVELKKDGVDAKFGMVYSDDKSIDLAFDYKPEVPFRYTGAIDTIVE